MVNKSELKNGPYNEINMSQRLKAERKAPAEAFFNTSGNPFTGFMRFLQRRPTPKKIIDEQKLLSDFAESSKRANRWGIVMAVFVVIMIIGVVWLKVSDGDDLMGFIPFLIGLIGLIISGVCIASRRTNTGAHGYTMLDYKAYVVERALMSQVEELIFEPNFGLPQSVFKDLNIVRTGNIYRTEDLVTGKYHNVYFAQCDLDVELNTDRVDVIYFKGRWVSIKYPKAFVGTVTVIDKKQNNRIKNHKGLDNIALENPVFNNMFAVESSNQQLAYYLLTPQIMEKLMYIKSASRGTVVACFKNGYLHIGINNHLDAFEPNRKNINLRGDIEKFMWDFSLVSDLIEILSIDRNVYIDSQTAQMPQQAPNNMRTAQFVPVAAAVNNAGQQYTQQQNAQQQYAQQQNAQQQYAQQQYAQQQNAQQQYAQQQNAQQQYAQQQYAQQQYAQQQYAQQQYAQQQYAQQQYAQQQNVQQANNMNNASR